VSNIQYPAFKNIEFARRVHFTRFLFVILFIYIMATIPRIALFILSFIYILSGPSKFIFALFKGKAAANESGPIASSLHLAKNTEKKK